MNYSKNPISFDDFQTTFLITLVVYIVLMYTYTAATNLCHQAKDILIKYIISVHSYFIFSKSWPLRR